MGKDPTTVIHKWNMSNYERKRTVTDYDTECYGKIYAWNIIAWIHLKWGNLGAELSEGCDCRVSKTEVLLGQICHKVHR